jgi:WD40 repeat protein
MNTPSQFWKKRFFYWASFMLTAVMGLASCGGGGGGGATSEVGGGGGGGGAAGGGNPSVQAIINAGASGKLFMASPSNFIEYDLATGVERVLRDKGGGSFTASLDGQEFVLTNQFVVGLDPADDREEMVFFNRDGRSSSRFLLEDGFGGTPRLSPDKQLVLVEWHSIDLGDAGGVSVPTVFRRDGSIVRRFAGFDAQYAWLPNGDILLSRGDAFFRTTAVPNAPITQIARLPGEDPRALILSPDGTRMAFTIGNFTILENTTWVMNLDGTGLRQIARGISSVAPAAFSPDGQQLLVSEGINFALVGPGFAVAGCAEMYIVPLNVQSVITLNPSNPAPALKLRRVNEATGEVADKTCQFSNAVSWRSLPELPPSVAGTPAQGAGINRGLAGRMWYSFANDLFRTDVNSGQTTMLARAPNTPFVSLDATEVMVFDRFLTPAASSLESVLTLNASTGALISRIDVDEGLVSPLKLSPDKTKIAARFENLDIGDGGADRIVTVFARDFSQVFTRQADARSWEWLPDGRLLLAGVNDIRVMDAQLRTVTPLITFNDPIGGLVSSRDGRKIAFLMASNVWMINSDGTGLVKLTETGRSLGAPEFSPDGRYLVVNSGDSPNQAWVIPTDGQRVPVMNLGLAQTSAFPLRITENGQSRLMFPGTQINWR